MRRIPSFFAAVLTLLLAAPLAHAQDSLDVLFRYLPDLNGTATTQTRVHFPGEFNTWGPNASGVIAAGAISQATYDATSNEYRYTKRLRVGGGLAAGRYQYKVNRDGGTSGWMTDPLNPDFNAADNNNSLLTVTNPLVFQLAREQEGTAAIVAVSAYVTGTGTLTALTFEVNGVQRDGMAYYNATTKLLRYVLPTSVAPGSQFKVTATYDGVRTQSATIGTIPPTVTKQARPAGLRDGITFNPDGTVTFSLFAPGKQYVYLIGDFSSWQPNATYLLKKDSVDASNVWYWGTFSGLSGREVRFQYFVDGLIRVADPYSEKVLFEGESTSTTNLPGQTSVTYPAGQTTQPVGVIAAGAPAYVWQTTNWVRPKPKDLVIYELLLRDFLAAHSFNALADTLAYLQRLGVTAIELMPVSEFDGDESWGYNPAFHGAVDKYYGSKDQLKRLVDMAHARGIAVILDVVYNHASGQSPLVRLWNDSPTGDPAALPTAQNPYANRTATHPFSVYNDLNHDSPATRRWLDQMNRYWMEEYRLDGFRYDLSKGFSQRSCAGDQGCWDAYDASRIYNLRRMADQIWTYAPDAVLILEHLAGNQEEYELHGYGTDQGRPGFLFWLKMMGPYNQSTMGYASSSDLRGSYFGSGGRGFLIPNSVAILEDHDEQRLMRKNFLYGNAVTGYSAKDLSTGVSRMGTAGAFFFAIPGPKMLWQFGELGYGTVADECLGAVDSCTGGRTDRRATRWTYWTSAAETARRALYNVWSAQMNLRQDQAIFTDPATTADVSSLGGIVKRLRLSRNGLNAVVLGNFDVVQQSMAGSFHSTGTWYEFYTGETLSVSDVNQQVTLAPGAYRLYTNQYIGKMTDYTSVAAEPVDGVDAPSALVLGGAAPNPFAETTQLNYGLPQTGRVSLAVYDVLGREVARLVDEEQAAGAYRVAFDGGDLPAGVYVVRLSAAGQVRTQTLVRAR